MTTKSTFEPYESLVFESLTPCVMEHYNDQFLDELDLTSNQHYDTPLLLRPFQDGKFGLGDSNTFGHLFVPDLQKFFKRLRSKINFKVKKFYGKQEKKVRLRVYAVGEYGPKRFRPHYHAIVWFDEPYAQAVLQQSVFESWKYGRVDCQRTTTGKAIGYVARYLNSNSCIPKILETSWAKPFSNHSILLGANAYKTACKGFENLTYEAIGRRSFNLDERVKLIAAPFSVQCSLFPKCYRYGFGDDNFNTLRYRLLDYLRQAYNGRTGKDIEELTQYEKVAWILDNCFTINGIPMIELFAGSKNLESTLYNAISVSRRFLCNCERFRCSPWYYYYKVIKKYYSDKDMDALKHFYERMVEDSNIPNFEPRWFMNDYVNIDVCEPDDPREMWNAMLQTKIASDNIKHKVQNEANFVLYSK